MMGGDRRASLGSEPFAQMRETRGQSRLPRSERCRSHPEDAMRIRRLAVAGTALLIVGGCTDGPTILDPASPKLSSAPDRSAQSARQVEVSGHFDALVDFSTLVLSPRGRNCLLQVKGQLVFTGTIAGTATGQTNALVSAPCDQVATTPPGTFSDVFRSTLAFEGTVDGEPARATMLYIGGVEPGGEIDARLILSNGVAGSLEVEAVVAVGGEYSGSVVIR